MKEALFKKFLKRGQALLLGLMLAAGLFLSMGFQAKAAYKYQIRLFAGRQGKFNSTAETVLKEQFPKADSIDVKDNVICITGVDPAEKRSDGSYQNKLSFSDSMVTVSSDKYLVQGLRKSGRDNNTIGDNTVNNKAMDINGDQDYVVGYYMADDVVEYKIICVDTSNDNAQLASSTHYGNAGDSIVVAFPYISGYTPKAYNGKITLSSTSSSNTFYFPYKENETKTKTKTVTNEEVVNQTTNNNTNTNRTVTNANGTTTNNAATNPNTNANNNAADNGGGNAANTGGNAGADEDEDEPEDTIDIANNEVPQAEYPTTEETTGKEIETTEATTEAPEKTEPQTKPLGIIPTILLVLATIAAIAGVAFLVKKKEEEEKKKEAASAKRKRRSKK